MKATLSTSQSTNQNQSGIIQLPVGAQVDSVQVNTGSVSWTYDRLTGKVTVTLTGGAVVNTTTGSSTYYPNSQTVSENQSGFEYNYQRWTSSGWAYDHTTGSPPSSVGWSGNLTASDGNSYAYSGTLNGQGASYGSWTYNTAPSNPTIGQIWQNSQRPWTESYSGTVTSSQSRTTTWTNYFYAYNVTIFHHVNKQSRFKNVNHFGSGHSMRGISQY